MVQGIMSSFSLLTTEDAPKSFEEIRSVVNPKSLFVKDYDELGLYLLKYMKNKCDMECENTRMCRGLVLQKDTHKIICAPPSKSIPLEKCKYIENKVDELRFEEFVDGTMINLFYCENEKYTGWLISTRSCIGANCRWYSDRNFSELFDETKNFQYDLFKKDCTYTFVLQHPENRIVEKIQNGRLILVNVNQVRDNNTIETLNVEEEQLDLFHKGMSISIPESYSFKSIEEAKHIVSLMEYEKQGIVVKYNNIRTKLRNPKYNFVKELRGNSNNLFRNYLELRQNGYMNAYLEFFPEMSEPFQGFMSQIHNLTQELFNWYQKCFVKKEVEHKDVPYVFKPLCYELHKHYLETNNIITFFKVKHYINTMPVKRQLFLFRNLTKEEDEAPVED